MRILLVSDLHYTLKQLDWVASVAGEYDLVVVAGDHLDIASIVEPDAQIAVVLEYLARMAAKTTVVACSGNHDLNARNELGERSARVARRGARVGRLRRRDAFRAPTTCWSRCARGGTGRAPRDVVDRQLADDAALVGDRRWIWVYHAPPDASPTSWTGKRHYGDEDLVAWIEQHQPDIVLCGHVHQSPFVDRRRLDRPDRLDVGRQRRAASRARSRRTSRSTPTPAMRLVVVVSTASSEQIASRAA